ncbi:MAG: cytochrome c biogenesis protein CcdA [Candidatus Omnitrophota bacterium]
MENVSFGVAFIAGILSFLSPCVLPLVPGYISFLSGLSFEEMRGGADHSRVFKKSGFTSIFFVLGFSLIFILLGASASAVGRLLSEYIGILTKTAGIMIIVLGLHLSGIIRIKWLNYEKKIQIKKISPGLSSAFLIGAAFAFGWTPCIGPILAGILALAAAQATMAKGMLLLAAYSLGLGIPFIITGFAVGFFMKFFEKYKRFIRWGEIAAGFLLILVGGLMFSGKLSALTGLIPPSFYKFLK